ncbi:metallophosphoesterase family protein [Qipengyuania sphaerica]|uniref:metallophosphoesterase family protein n=1 Tax=Qipengyuania sphaerica TaxID=2867243 RepID=UPI001C86746D|nr:metallophosphoesterase family protein [Qipengyuania sphaerica]MBX7539382.1 serine/threonine protein phosphatase [Qipengyuania sphaerica]
MKPWRLVANLGRRESRARGSRATAEIQGSYAHRLFERGREFERIYAIGDLHGEFDLFREALKVVNADNASKPAARSTIILLGDVVDRGPQSKQLLQVLQQFHTASTSFIVLRGNHEEMLLQSARGDEVMQRLWLRSGGRQTLESYGIDPDRFARRSPTERAEMLLAALGDETLQWLDSRPLSYRSGSYYFCHAGVRPGVELNKQVASDLLWIRNKFLYSDEDHGAVVVHGHTEVDSPEFLYNRINIDTAAHKSGRLSVIGMQGTDLWLLSVSADTRNTKTTVQKLIV